DVVEITLGLRLRREVLAPFPVVEEFLREQVAVGVALGVKARTGIAVPVPRSTDAPTAFEQLHREARFARAIQLVYARDAGADDEYVEHSADCNDRLVCGSWRSRIGSARRCPCRSRSRCRTGSPSSATSTRISINSKPSCCGLARGRWRA